jgi:ribosome-binding factor A
VSRAERFAAVVQEELAMLLGEVKDPRVSEAGLITVTHVRVSDDLGVARVLLTVHGATELEQAKLLEGLKSASSYLRRQLGRALQSKKVPELRFHLDETDARADRVETLLREIAGEKPGEKKE